MGNLWVFFFSVRSKYVSCHSQRFELLSDGTDQQHESRLVFFKFADKLIKWCIKRLRLTLLYKLGLFNFTGNPTETTSIQFLKILNEIN